MSKYVVEKWEGERSRAIHVLWRKEEPEGCDDADEQADESGRHCPVMPSDIPGYDAA